ncbi:MAG: hypothetical protein LBR78_03195, partial [Holosporales bacterium]|nr:hypothetical protein [Holosporales bacterium]
VDEVEIGDVVERGVADHVMEMQGVVARQAHQLRCYQEVIGNYERLSRKTLKVLQGLSDSDAGVARERTLMRLADEVGIDLRMERATSEEPETGEPAEVEPLLRTGTLHQKATTLIEGLDEVRERTLAEEMRATPSTGPGSILDMHADLHAWNYIKQLNPDTRASAYMLTPLMQVIRYVIMNPERGDNTVWWRWVATYSEEPATMTVVRISYKVGTQQTNEWAIFVKDEAQVAIAFERYPNIGATLRYDELWATYDQVESTRTAQVGKATVRQTTGIKAFVPSSSEEENTRSMWEHPDQINAYYYAGLALGHVGHSARTRRIMRIEV